MALSSHIVVHMQDTQTASFLCSYQAELRLIIGKHPLTSLTLET